MKGDALNTKDNIFRAFPPDQSRISTGRFAIFPTYIFLNRLSAEKRTAALGAAVWNFILMDN
jgi:hypothetical protein